MPMHRNHSLSFANKRKSLLFICDALLGHNQNRLWFHCNRHLANKNFLLFATFNEHQYSSHCVLLLLLSTIVLVLLHCIEIVPFHLVFLRYFADGALRQTPLTASHAFACVNRFYCSRMHFDFRFSFHTQTENFSFRSIASCHLYDTYYYAVRTANSKEDAHVQPRMQMQNM